MAIDSESSEEAEQEPEPQAGGSRLLNIVTLAAFPIVIIGLIILALFTR